MAARQSEKILKNIRKEGFYSRKVLNKRTRNGESRMNNCVKYCLGNGYRMITQRQGNHFYILFTGHHDKADLWLEQHKQESFSANDNKFTAEVICIKNDDVESKSRDFTSKQNCNVTDEFEELLQKKLDDTVLRSIFSGIVK